MTTSQILNAISTEIRGLQAIFSTTFDLREGRAVLQMHGAFSLPADTVFPGDLAHVTVSKLLALATAMDALDAAMMAPDPTTGVPPIKAIVDMIP